MSRWMPPGGTEAEYSALHEGFPPWMMRPFTLWFQDQVTRPTSSGPKPSVSLVQAYDTITRRINPLASKFSVNGARVLLQELDEDELLWFVDFVVYANAESSRGLHNEELETILVQAGSAWRVGQRAGNPGLERRVPLGVQEAAEETMSQAGDAGQLLSEAWHAAFGKIPDPEEAYEKAIKSVEEAGASVVSPANARATLGSMIRDVHQQSGWTLPISVSSVPEASEVVLNMMRALWEGQESRHGGNGYRKPTQGEAETAVLLAVPLVHWFASGLFSRNI